MSRVTIEELCLGTATFGLDYGVANKNGRIAKDEVFRILDYCRCVGLNALDAAVAYGESESIIGEYMDNNKCSFKIISKLPALERFDTQEVEDTFYRSLDRLKSSCFYGYLIHKFDDFLKYEDLWGILQRLRGRRLVEKIGFSLYHPQQLELICSKGVDFDIIQIPYNIFDRRFFCSFQGLRRHVEINARSVFLQGLVFLKPDMLTGNLVKARPYIEALQNLAKEKDISLSALCLNFVLLNPRVDKVIIGVNSLEHLIENVEGLWLAQRVKDIYGELAGLSITDEDILVPYQWRLT